MASNVLERLRSKWDGKHRGIYTREDLRTKFSLEMDDVSWTMRQLCLQSHKYFCETIWKLPAKSSAICCHGRIYG